MIAVVDYGVGNLFSLTSSIKAIGAPCVVTGSAEELAAADKIILPGVGAFGDAAQKLNKTGLGEVVVARAHAGVPTMGICLGMQLLFDESTEYGTHAGLSLIPGRILPLLGAVGAGLKVPQMGWNRLDVKKDDPLTREADGKYVYYVHSYYAAECAEHTVASSEYGVDVPGVVRNGCVCGCQFHPEKSGEVGLSILRAFCFA